MCVYVRLSPQAGHWARTLIVQQLEQSCNQSTSLLSRINCPFIDLVESNFRIDIDTSDASVYGDVRESRIMLFNDKLRR